MFFWGAESEFQFTATSLKFNKLGENKKKWLKFRRFTVDLLEIIIEINTSPNMYFIKPGKGKSSPSLFHLPTNIDKHEVEHILFLHALAVTQHQPYTNRAKGDASKCPKKIDLTFHLTRFINPNANEETQFKEGLR